MHKAHGGKIIERILDRDKSESLKKGFRKFANIEINFDRLQEVANITTGVFSPLEGFMGQEDYNSVIFKSRLSSGPAWTIPIVLDISKEEAGKLSKNDEAILIHNSMPVALMKIEGLFSFDKAEYARNVFGTDNKNHPGVKKVLEMHDFLAGGKLDLIQEPENDFSRYTFTPKQTRAIFKEKGWVDIAGFQTRNVPHLGHEYVQKTALSFVDGLFINPVIGRKKKGDFRDQVILAAYDELVNHYYLSQRVLIAVLHTEMRYAGPKEAIHHAIVRKNFGCTHFIVGRDHAGVGDFYDPFAAHKIFDEFPDLEIIPIFFRSFFYCNKCSSIANDKTCPHPPEEHINFSGTRIRESLVRGEAPSGNMMRVEVAKAILAFDNPFVE